MKETNYTFQNEEEAKRPKDSRLTRGLFFAGVLVAIKLGEVILPEYRGIVSIICLFGGIGLYGIIATIADDRRTKRDIVLLILLELVCIVHIVGFLWYIFGVLQR